MSLAGCWMNSWVWACDGASAGASPDFGGTISGSRASMDYM